MSANGERSFLEAFLNGGHSPATAVAAGFDPAASARGVAASVIAEAVTVEFVGATVVLGPVVGRVTQRSAVVLLEVGSTAAVGCVLTDGATGGQHRQVWLGKNDSSQEVLGLYGHVSDLVDIDYFDVFYITGSPESTWTCNFRISCKSKP